ncbi:MAG: hypothetical protein U0325_13750 [Polyangiales bacterium]
MNARLLDATAATGTGDARLATARQWALEAVGLARAGGDAGPIAAALEPSFRRHLSAIDRVAASPNPISLDWRPSSNPGLAAIPCAMGFRADSGAGRPTGGGCTRSWDLAPFDIDRCDAITSLGLGSASGSQSRVSPDGVTELTATARYQATNSADPCSTYEARFAVANTALRRVRTVSLDGITSAANALEITACANAPARVGQPGAGLASSRFGSAVLPVSRDLGCAAGAQSIALAADYLADVSLAPSQADTEAACAADLTRLLTAQARLRCARTQPRRATAHARCSERGLRRRGAPLLVAGRADLAGRSGQLAWLMQRMDAGAGHTCRARCGASACRRCFADAATRGCRSPRRASRGRARDGPAAARRPTARCSRTPRSRARCSTLITARAISATAGRAGGAGGRSERQLVSFTATRTLAQALRLAALVQRRVAGSTETAQSATRVALLTLLRLRGLEDRVLGARCRGRRRAVVGGFASGRRAAGGGERAAGRDRCAGAGARCRETRRSTR